MSSNPTKAALIKVGTKGLGLATAQVLKTFALSARSFFESLPRAARRIRRGGAIVTVSGMDTTRAVPLHGNARPCTR